MASDAERRAMLRAVELAALGLGRTRPNPVVGCVVLDAAGRPVGEGWHERAGGPHAEVVAVRAAGDGARAGTAVVTLEPCAHSGRTGPCTDALTAAGVRRVVYAVADPNPVAAGGAQVLRDRGVDVEAGLLAAEAARVNEAWLLAATAGRPFVTWKYAASLDGQVAAADGSSRWITGPEARADVHRLRAEADAVVAGIGTALADDPALTVRLEGETRRPLRVVVDSTARLPVTGTVLDGSATTLVAVTPAAPTERVAALRARADVAVLAAGPAGRVDLAALLTELHRLGVRSVLLEGGPTLAGSFLDDGLVDRVVGYLAPALLGGGRWPALAGDGAATIAGARRLHLDDVTRIGPDLRVTATMRDRTMHDTTTHDTTMRDTTMRDTTVLDREA